MFDIPIQNALKAQFDVYIEHAINPCSVMWIKSLKLPNPSPAFKSELTMFYGKLLRENV